MNGPERQRRRIEGADAAATTTPASTSTSAIATSPAISDTALVGGVRELTAFKDQLLTERASDGSLSLMLDANAVENLASSINLVSNACLLGAITTEELLQKLDMINQVSDYAVYARSLALEPTSSSSTRRLSSATEETDLARSAFARLPADVIDLIMDQLADSYALPSCTSDWNFGHPDMKRHKFWENLGLISRTCQTFHSVCGPRFLSELHTEPRYLVKQLNYLRRDSSANLRQQIKRLSIGLFDYEYSLLRNSADEGFSLPELLSLLPNLTHLSLSTTRTMRRRSPESDSFSQYVGGVNLIDVICEHNTKLQHLNFDPPGSVIDVAKLLRKLPDLETLALGAHFVPNRVLMAEATARLRVFWAPSVILNGQQITAISTDALRSFAVAVDPEGLILSSVPQASSPAANLSALDKAFENLGPQLRELCVTVPNVDSADMTGAFGQFVTTLALTMIEAAPAPDQAGPAPDRAGPAGIAGSDNGNGHGQANGTAGEVNDRDNAEQLPAPGPAPAAARPPANAPAPLMRGPPGILPPQMFVFPGGAPLQRRNRNGHNRTGDRTPLGPDGNNIPEPPLPFFFDKFVRSCPNLWHLGLLGQQYTHELLFDLPSNLEHLCLSKPGQTESLGGGIATPQVSESSAVVEHLCTLISSTSDRQVRRGLKRVELSGKAGEWKASERKMVKEACDKANVDYASVDILPP
ncbi:hypothetical protein OIV83_005469 [Microbotryomycetes sp. JL201]|nr:hypothetical protein OIV83_005469 [Microbotryomycetes sp. JL201]